jgi:hypothetical protein
LPAREAAAIVSNDREIAGKLIRQVFRAVGITGATMENQQHGSGAAHRAKGGHFVCFELAVSRN